MGMEVRPIFRVGTVVHLCRVFLNALTLCIDLVVLTPRLRVETLKDVEDRAPFYA